LNASTYSNLSLWINGGTGGQKLQLYVEYGTNSGPAIQLATLPANSWQLVQVPLAKLGVAAVTNLNRLNLQLTSAGSTATFYVDDVQLTVKPAPLVHLVVNATQTVREADARWFGVNTAVWDNHFDT